MFIEHQPCLGTIRLFAHLILSNTNKVSSAIPVVQVTKLSPREINQLTQSHPAGGRAGNFSPACLVPKPYLLQWFLLHLGQGESIDGCCEMATWGDLK